MSTIHLRRTQFRPDEMAVAVKAGVVTIHWPGLAWQGTVAEFTSEFNEWTEVLWSKYCTAVRHAAALEAMLPKQVTR